MHHEDNLDLNLLYQRLGTDITAESVDRVMQDYTPWFHPHKTTANTQKTGIEGMWLNLFEVLFWYCCLQRKSFGQIPDEMEMVDSSPYVSGMVTQYESMEDIVTHIEHAMHFFVKNEVIGRALIVYTLEDVHWLWQSPCNIDKALTQLLSAFIQPPKQAHYIRLSALLHWYRRGRHTDHVLHCMHS